jgi:hypothetical protein
MNSPYAETTARDIMRTVAKRKFRPFVSTDWMGFQGCEDKEPLISDDDDFHTDTCVIDGHVVCLLDPHCNWCMLDTTTGEITLA